jgi:excinuclease ABC subunit A
LEIRIQKASENNLQDLDVEFHDGLTAVTGISGSGKSSLVFSTLYHEARRRFLDIFARGSASTRLSPAKVQEITGLGPTVAIEQNILNRNPKSTLATASGLHPFFRLLFANFGVRKCPNCEEKVHILSSDEIVNQIAKITKSDSLKIYAPIILNSKGSHTTLLEFLNNRFGAESLVVDGSSSFSKILDPQKSHDIDVFISDISDSTDITDIREAIQIAASLGASSLKLRSSNDLVIIYSISNVCSSCGTWLSEVTPIHFHTPCQYCKGLGCKRCNKTGLYPEVARVYWKDHCITELLKLSVNDVYHLFIDNSLPETASRLVYEIERRLRALITVGLGYISLNRSSPSLSRGESQRVRLALALSSRLEDMLIVLDEPTIGLSISDVNELMPSFRQLPGSVIYVEHDRVAASAADYIIDLGPGAGVQGGNLIFKGSPHSLWSADSHTGRFFSMRDKVAIPEIRPEPKSFLRIKKAFLRNLKNIDISIPLNRCTVVTGPSGSGKSTLVEDVLYASLSEDRPIGCQSIKSLGVKAVLVDQSPIGKNPRSNPATYSNLATVIREIFASFTGFTPSHFSFNTKIGACPECNGMGALEVRMRYLPSTWIECSFCRGKRFSREVLEAVVKFEEKSFSIADFYELTVDEAFEWLVEKKGIKLSIKHSNSAKRILLALRDIGLGYLKLGQPSPSLSGGEAQRVKLAKHLGKRNLADKILILDEPSTGLHPHDISGLLNVLDKLVRAGATVVIVEHNSDFIRAADWIIDLGPAAGPEGGHLIYSGVFKHFYDIKESVTVQGLIFEESIKPRTETLQVPSDDKTHFITINQASAHNLKNITVKFPKGKLTVVTGVSGSGKSSLVNNVLKSEAERRFLETLSLYERQGIGEGPEAPVKAITGLGVAVSVDPTRIGRGWYNYRSTVGLVTEISHHLSILLSCFGDYLCPQCNELSERKRNVWICPSCDKSTPIPPPRSFSTSNYSSACTTCHGVGNLRKPEPKKLIINPEKPICSGAMYSPGFFPKGYICKRYNGGYYFIKALAEKYGFDTHKTPWNELSANAQQAFLFGDELQNVQFESKKMGSYTRENVKYPGFYGWIRDWDVGGTYTTTEICLDCHGSGFRSEILDVKIGNKNIHELRNMTFKDLIMALEGLTERNPDIKSNITNYSMKLIFRRLRFLNQVRLGYLHLSRLVMTLSAGEAQRIRLAGLLGSGLNSLTVLMDEPSRGLHPSEIEALLQAITGLRDEGNSIIIVEHDLQIIKSADKVIDLGPGPGVHGGNIVVEGKPEEICKTDSPTGMWLSGRRKMKIKNEHGGLDIWIGSKLYRKPHTWLKIVGACENNLKGDLIEIPLNLLVGICGVSGSGKSSLIHDTLGRVLAPKKQTTSVAYEPIEPGKYENISGAPKQAMVIDQSRKQVYSPLTFFNLRKPILSLYASSDDAIALGLDERQLSQQCSACKGSGQHKLDMGFLPNVYTICETCKGIGLSPEAWQVRLLGYTLEEMFNLTIDEVYELLKDEVKISRPLKAAIDVGLGYLVLKQPRVSLSGGECQRLKIAKELSKKTPKGSTLYILDEPTVGQHLEDVNRLLGVLYRLVEAGNTVVLIEHHPHVLASCDWLIELGPEGGSKGGYVIAKGSPLEISKAKTPSAPYLKEILEEIA